MQGGTGGFCVASDSQFSNWEDLEISSLQKHENEVVEQNNTTLEMMLESIGRILIRIRGTCEYALLRLWPF
jgi:hypothetical protein